MAFLSSLYFKDFIVVTQTNKQTYSINLKKKNEGILFFRAVIRDHNNFSIFLFVFLVSTKGLRGISNTTIYTNSQRFQRPEKESVGKFSILCFGVSEGTVGRAQNYYQYKDCRMGSVCSQDNDGVGSNLTSPTLAWSDLQLHVLTHSRRSLADPMNH